jgi:hypothetical protein
MQKIDGNHVGDTLTQFINDYGVPKHLTFDGTSVQTGSKTRFMDAIQKYEIKYHVSGPLQPNENPAEQSIHEVKKQWYCIMLKREVPARLWDYGFSWVCETENICVNLSKYAESRTPLEINTVIRQTFRNICILNSTIGSCTDAMQALEKLYWGVGSVSHTGLDS